MRPGSKDNRWKRDERIILTTGNRRVSGHEPSGSGFIRRNRSWYDCGPRFSSTILFSTTGIHRRNDSPAPVFRLNVGTHGARRSLLFPNRSTESITTADRGDRFSVTVPFPPLSLVRFCQFQVHKICRILGPYGARSHT